MHWQSCEKVQKLRMKMSRAARKQEAFKSVCVCACSAECTLAVCVRVRACSAECTLSLCVCVCILAESAVWAVLKSALRV